MTFPWRIVSVPLLALLLGAPLCLARPRPIEHRGADSLEHRIEPPRGFGRVEAADGSFGAWLRRLPLRPGRSDVYFHDGRLKRNQRAHHAVFDVDVGPRDLQQCADAVIRLRAEYLRTAGCEGDVAFDFTSGDTARWREWRNGQRPHISGNDIRWTRSAAPDGSYASFRRYLDTVFAYAGTHSLQLELEPVDDPGKVRPGDVFIQGGFPGHAVLVVDIAEDADGSRIFLLAQSFMPAQDIHVLRNPASSLSPWYEAASSGPLVTPEWRFQYSDLRRFPESDCGRRVHRTD